VSKPQQRALDVRVRELAATANIETIPLRGADEKIHVVPVDTTVTMTCSPKWGLERTLQHTASAVRAGYRVVPHLAARQLTGEAQLRAVVARLGELGVRDLYVVGGDDAEPAGPFDSAGKALAAISTMEHGFTEIGVGCYPEGHPKISDDNLLQALRSKQTYATYLVSQLCFDSHALLDWLRSVRQQGITLPIRVGIAGPLQMRKLMELSVRIGVGSSIRYLSKQHGLIGGLVRGSAYQPEILLDEIAAAPDFTELGIAKIHLNSFNQFDATVGWQQRIAGQATA
jgi:methylenetetrahydrofolate reductase (NADH)